MHLLYCTTLHLVYGVLLFSASKWTTLSYTQSLWNGECVKLHFILHNWERLPKELQNVFSAEFLNKYPREFLFVVVFRVKVFYFCFFPLSQKSLCMDIMIYVLAWLSLLLEFEPSRWIDVLRNEEECFSVTSLRAQSLIEPSPSLLLLKVALVSFNWISVFRIDVSVSTGYPCLEFIWFHYCRNC